MPDASVKMGVTGLQQFKQGMNQAQQSVKTLDAQLKLNEKQLQATGDKETYMQQKSKLLQQQITQQNAVIKQGQQALAAMEKNGVNPASQAYQKMQQQVLNAQTALIGMQQDLDGVGSSAQETTQKTDQLAESLNGINKKVSFDAVLNGIGKITDGMEAAARKVASLATDVWNTMGAAAAWADNEMTLATMYGLDVESLQQMQYAAGKAETTVDAIVKSQQKLKNNMVYGSDEIMAAFDKLGVSVESVDGKTGILGRIAEFVDRFNGQDSIRGYRDSEDVFWDLGEALQNYGDEVERDAMAQKLLGTSWRELQTLFQNGRDVFEANKDLAPKVEEENVKKLNDLSEALEDMDLEYQALKKTVTSELAPGFTTLSNSISGLLHNFNEYLQTDKGKEKMEALSQAVTDLFTGISEADFSTAMETAKSSIDAIKGALDWISGNQKGIVTAIQAIGGAFLALKAAEVVGGLAQGAVALKNLLGNGAAGAAGANAARAVGNAAATGSAVMPVTGTAPNWLNIGGTVAAAKTALESSLKTGFGLVGELSGANKKIAIVEESPAIRPAPMLKHGTKATKTATEDQMQTAAQNLAYEQYMAALDALEKSIDASYEHQLNNPDISPSKLFMDMVAGPLLKVMNSGKGLGDADFMNIFDEFKHKYIESFSDDWEGSTSGLMSILQDAMDEAGGTLKIETTPELIPDAVIHLQTSLDGASLSIPVVPDFSSIDGQHVNGLPFVPFDGYIAALHKGERVVPASQNKSVHFTNNNYFEGTRMYNNTDVQGLAAAIAERSRHNLQGVGG